MPAPDFIAAHYAQRRRLAVDAAAYALAQWSKVDRDDIARSWLRLIPGLAAIITAAQKAAAQMANPYVDSAAVAEGVATAAQAAVSAAAFAGVAADGRSLLSLLFQPVIVALTSIKAGAPVDRAMAGGAANLDMIVRSEVTDAGRTADQVALTARGGLDGYIRVVVGETCARCIILGGRWYRWSDGFLRHPRCDCVQLGASQARAAGLVQDPQEIYDRLTAAQRVEAGWSQADQNAIAEGADINQVTNAQRGVYVAGGREFTREGTTRAGQFGRRGRGARRLTPNQIFADAKDRDEAIHLLRANGYLSGDAVRRAVPADPAGEDNPLSWLEDDDDLGPQQTPPVPPAREREPVPQSETPWHRSLDGVAALVRGAESGVADTEVLSGGGVAVTGLVTFHDGSRAVSKRAVEVVVDVPIRHQADAEQLASLVAKAVAVQAPSVYRDAEDHVYMSFVDDAESAMDAFFDPPGGHGEVRARMDGLLESDLGRRLGLLDLLLNNRDRHEGNWLLRGDDTIVAIDHGAAWGNLVNLAEDFDIVSEAEAAPHLMGFTSHYVRRSDAGSWIDGVYVDNDLTAEDIRHVMQRLDQLGDDFRLLGRQDWLTFTQMRLSAIGRHAKGTRNRIAL